MQKLQYCLVQQHLDSYLVSALLWVSLTARSGSFSYVSALSCKRFSLLSPVSCKFLDGQLHLRHSPANLGDGVQKRFDGYVLVCRGQCSTMRASLLPVSNSFARTNGSAIQLRRCPSRGAQLTFSDKCQRCDGSLDVYPSLVYPDTTTRSIYPIN